MAYKSLFTAISDQSTAGPLLERAAALAKAWDAHLEVVCYRLHPLTSAYAYGDVVVRTEVDLKATLEEAGDLRDFARAELRRAEIASSVEPLATFAESLGAEIAARARFSDLAVLSLPSESVRPRMAGLVLDAALFDAHAPVLLLPSGARFAPSGSRVTVGWNDSDAALSSVHRALPLLTEADWVEIVLVDPQGARVDGFDPGTRLAEMLARHGASVELAELPGTLPRVSEMLMRRVRETGSSLLVLGAYSHSRLREAVLGGVTRDLIEGATVPLFLSR